VSEKNIREGDQCQRKILDMDFTLTTYKKLLQELLANGCYCLYGVVCGELSRKCENNEEIRTDILGCWNAGMLG